MVMKIDLSKAYNMVDWGLLRMILYKIGLGRASVNWIMGCVTNTSMAIIINVKKSSFFKPGRGLRQGCALSPLLFILVMDSLSLKINNEVILGNIKGIKLSHCREISHNFFVDDVMPFGMLIRLVWKNYHEIFQRFEKASRMMANIGKSCVFYEEEWRVLAIDIASMFNLCTALLSMAFKYMGFHMKTNNYRSKDWEWLVVKV